MYQAEAMKTMATRKAKPLPKSRIKSGTSAATEITTNMLTQG
jgi:hypothetical protein